MLGEYANIPVSLPRAAASTSQAILSEEGKMESFIEDADLVKFRQAANDHPETEHTAAGGWCKHCGCGNDLFGYKHLRSCNRPLSSAGQAPPTKPRQGCKEN
jgi:hypothetical protein